MRLTTMLAPLLAAGLALSACGSETADTSASTSAAESSPDGGESPVASEDSTAPKSPTWDFTATTLSGGSFDGAQLAGKPAVLWFWAPWCPTCRAQASAVESVSAKYGDRVRVVGVGGLSDADDIRDFARETEGPTHLVDVEGAVWRHFGITAQSTYVLLDADGEVVVEGYLDNDELPTKVSELLG